MSSLRIVVRLVDLTALRTPNVLSIETYAVACLQIIDARRDIDIVQDQDRLAW